MKSAVLAACALALLAAAPPRAEAAYCSSAFSAIAEEIRRTTGRTVSCEEIERADASLRLEASPAGGAWEFTGEANFRASLAERQGVAIPPEVLPIGHLERRAPAGARVLLVFGLDMPQRSDAVAALARLEEPVAATELAELLGGGSIFDRVGFFIDDGEGYPQSGVWKKFKNGGLWGRHQPRPEGTRECLPCAGWLCPKEALACFSDFNADGDEEVHLTDDCRGKVCGLAMFTPDDKGGVRLLFNALLSGSEWKERPEGWVLTTKPKCGGRSFCPRPGGFDLGDSSCVRPMVFLLRRGGRRVETSQKLRDAIYPISVRPLPKGCRMSGDEQLVYSNDNGFILYEK